MKRGLGWLRTRSLWAVWLGLAALLVLLMIYKLGSLIGGLSKTEITAATSPVGWHGIYHHPLYLPLQLLRSVDFFLFKNHGQTLTRLPNVVIGVASVGCFAWLIALWHSLRTAFLATLLFMTAAWTLHASRLASFDVLFLAAVPALLLIHTLLQRHHSRAVVWYGSLLVWLLALYTPGLVWLVLVSLFFARKALSDAWNERNFGQHVIYLFIFLAGLPLLIIDLFRSGQLVMWLGAPAHFESPFRVAKHLLAVPVHLFLRGPQNPELWLGRAPLLDIFSLAVCLIGIYFYATHLSAARSRLLTAMTATGVILVCLGGPVSFSLLVPLMYVAVATGLAYIITQWLQPFPNNPFARTVGLAIVAIAVVLSCTYNLRAYFVAWPHNPTSRAVFQYRR